MTEIARFAENSLFAPSEPFFGETQTSQVGRKKKQKQKNRGGNFCGIGTWSDAIRIYRNHSEPIEINQNKSD